MRKILPALLIAAVLLLEVAFVYQYVVPREHYIFDFVQPWTSARALLLEHKNPYSPEVTREVQIALLGRPIPPENCQHTLLYPAFFAFIIPHFLLPYRLGVSVWLVTLQALLVVATWLIVRCLGRGRGISTVHLLLLTLAAVTFRYSLLNLGYTQYTILVLFWAVVTLWLWDRGQFLVAGVALALTTFKPQLVIVLIPLWLLLAVTQRHWRFLVGFGGGVGLLLALPFFFVGNWIPSYLDTLAHAVNLCQTPVYTDSNSTSKLVVFLALTGGVLALALLRSRYWQGRQLGYLLSLGTAITLLGTPYAHSYDLVIALLPLLYGLVTLRGLPGWPARLLELAFWATLVILPWLLWALAPNHHPDPLERWFFPSVVLGLLAGLAAVEINQAPTDEPPAPA
jgi:hypothetical protein